MSRLRIGVAALALLTSVATGASERPNVVLFLVDDLGWRDLGCYGATAHETPNIDRLARQGIRFTSAYANAPNCAPSRACLMTGQYPPRHGVYTVGSSARGESPARRLIPTPNTTTLAADAVTLAEVLSADGYTCAAAGKWHLGDDPRTQGFDVNIGGHRAGYPKSYYSPYRNPKLPDGPDGEYLTDRLTDDAIAFVDAHRDRPFFLYMSYYAVHTPIQGREDLVAHYRTADDGAPALLGAGLFGDTPPPFPPTRPAYAAMVTAVDESVGRILATLDTLGLADDTIVILFSDNGGHGPHTSMDPLRGAKGMLYEGGIREPLLVRWPGRVRPGRQSDEPVIGLDLFPTIVEATGTRFPEDLPIDGESLVPLLDGWGALPRTAIYWHFPAYLERTRNMPPGTWRTTPRGVIRMGDYKLIESFEDGALELYDLSRDIGEAHDLAAERPDVARELHARLAAWRASLDAPELPVNPEYVPSPDS